MKPIHSHNGNLPTEDRGLEILLGLFPSSLFQLLKKKMQQYKKNATESVKKPVLCILQSVLTAGMAMASRHVFLQ